MILNPIFATFFAIFLISTPQARADSVILENFQRFTKGKLPEDGWTHRGGDPDGIYQIMEEGLNRFLNAKDRGQSVQVFEQVSWKLKAYPKLQWRWRVLKFPEGSDERVSETNDSAAAIYVVFPRRFLIPEAIKYVWSEKVPVGTKIVRNSRFPAIVVRSGGMAGATWVTESRNVKKDYEEHFGRSPAPNPVAIGFLTDANQTKKEAEASYDDFELLTAP